MINLLNHLNIEQRIISNRKNAIRKLLRIENQKLFTEFYIIFARQETLKNYFQTL
ncbi:MAG: hypothetical protein OJF59_002827 [Cytophagales bacterium]|nr:MAG: hypothetical protein OJF59_002827 [Cytophagales bacterium]